VNFVQSTAGDNLSIPKSRLIVKENRKCDCIRSENQKNNSISSCQIEDLKTNKEMKKIKTTTQKLLAIALITGNCLFLGSMVNQSKFLKNRFALLGSQLNSPEEVIS
jgi:hypothetical protein